MPPRQLNHRRFVQIPKLPFVELQLLPQSLELTSQIELNRIDFAQPIDLVLQSSNPRQVFVQRSTLGAASHNV